MQTFYWMLLVLVFLSSFAMIGMMFYLGHSKIKEVDRLVYGFEITGDSIFFQGQRVITYGGAFAWRWGAKRSHLLHIRDHFDKKFQRPFIITFYLLWIGTISMIAGATLDKFFLHVT